MEKRLVWQTIANDQESFEDYILSQIHDLSDARNPYKAVQRIEARIEARRVLVDPPENQDSKAGK